MKNEISDLDKRLELEQKNRDLITSRQLKKSEYNSVVSERAMGAQIRSRAIWAEQGERSTAYFLKLEKAIQVANRIDALRGRNGSILSKDSEIFLNFMHVYIARVKGKTTIFYHI